MWVYINKSLHIKEKIHYLFVALFLIIALPFLPFFNCHLLSYANDIDLESKVIKNTLPNGITILIMERHQVPICSLYIRYKVGMVNEPSGQRGTAHLLEHLLFKGTKTLGTIDYKSESILLEKIKRTGKELDKERLKLKKGDGDPNLIDRLSSRLSSLQDEHKRFVIKDEMGFLYSQNGGMNFNAFTSADLTTYTVSLPSNRIELWARIESDRMMNPVLREFYSERNVVLEERLQSYESQPSRKLFEQFFATAFIAHPYRNPIIGWESELEMLDPDKTMEFFSRYYAPNNVVIAAVGDINPDNFMNLMETYFGPIPAQPAIETLITEEPPQLGEKRIKVVFDAEPQLLIGYHKPALPSSTDYVFDIISSVLADGRTSRLYKRMVIEEGAASSVDAINGMPGGRYPNLFIIRAVPLYPNTTQDLEKIIYEELERLKTEPISDWELGKIKNQIQAEHIRSLASNSGMASKLSYFEAIAGNWRYLSTFYDVILTITPEQIQDTAKRYLEEHQRSVATLVKPINKEAGL